MIPIDISIKSAKDKNLKNVNNFSFMHVETLTS